MAAASSPCAQISMLDTAASRSWPKAAASAAAAPCRGAVGAGVAPTVSCTVPQAAAPMASVSHAAARSAAVCSRTARSAMPGTPGASLSLPPLSGATVSAAASAARPCSSWRLVARACHVDAPAQHTLNTWCGAVAAAAWGTARLCGRAEGAGKDKREDASSVARAARQLPRRCVMARARAAQCSSRVWCWGVGEARAWAQASRS